MKRVADLLSVDGLPRHEAERLLCHVTGRDRSWLAAVQNIDAEAASRFEELASRRLDGEPLQYLEGTVQFGPIELAVDRRALIPRPETELLWEMAVDSLGQAGPGTVIVDLCTGSGNLALALKDSFPEAKVFGVDSSPAALELAEENASHRLLDVEWVLGDLFDALPGELVERVDLLVSNPPYLSESEWESVPEEISDHEPKEALVAGPLGDEVLARLGEEAYWWLGVEGWVLCEIGEEQGRRAYELFSGLDREVRPDTTGRDRILVGRKGASCRA